jgi:hypothetical protein
MAFLSLAKGDPNARELLQQAIRARYALRPIMLDSVRLSLMGKGQGVLGLPVQRKITLSLVAVNQWRWEETRKLLGIIPAGVTATMLENGIYYENNGKTLLQSDSAEVVQGIRRQLWGMLAFFLTPLTAQGVTLKSVDAQTIEVSRDSDTNDLVTLCVHGDGNIAIQARCHDSSSNQPVNLTISSQGLVQTLNGFSVPTQIVFAWGSSKSETFTVTGVEVNPAIAPAEISLAPRSA